MAGLVGLALRIGAPPSTVALTLIALTAATLPTFISLAAAGRGCAARMAAPSVKRRGVWPPWWPRPCPSI